MSKVHEKYLADVKTRISSSSNNLLAMAAPLESSSNLSSKAKNGTSTSETATKVEVKDVPAQKSMMVIALLAVGVLRPALSMLTIFPWLVDVHREIADLLLRVLKTSIAPLYDSVFTKDRNPSFLQARARYAAGGVSTPSRKPHLTLIAPPPPGTYTHDFVFFFPKWIDSVPICHSMDDIEDIVEPLMSYIGLHLSRDPVFLTKLLRLGRMQLSSTVSDRA